MILFSTFVSLCLQEAKVNKDGKAPHSKWRNYDDMNEYFWTNRCFNRLGWLEESSNYLVAPVGIILWAFINLPQEGRMHLEMLLWNLEEIEVFCGMG
jgi:hypothetical protein